LAEGPSGAINWRDFLLSQDLQEICNRYVKVPPVIKLLNRRKKMRVENFFTILIAFGLLVNCFGLGTDKKNSGLDKNAENLLLADYLNKTNVEYLEINGKWKDNMGTITISMQKKMLFLVCMAFGKV
jgi:hypothetical protein